MDSSLAMGVTMTQCQALSVVLQTPQTSEQQQHRLTTTPARPSTHSESQKQITITETTQTPVYFPQESVGS